MKTEAVLRAALPLHLRERVRTLGSNAPLKEVGRHVLYWMRPICLRAHENPALDCAMFAANNLNLPLVILMHIEDQYANATARRQIFLLEGAREAQQELVESRLPQDAVSAGRVALKICVDRNAQRCGYSFIESLLQKTAVVVAEEPFCNPFLAGLEHISAVANREGTPLWIVDTASVVPTALVSSRDCHRAYSYESGTKKLHEARVSSVYSNLTLENIVQQADNAFQTSAGNIDLRALSDAELLELVRDMDVDQTVAPVSHITKGGSSAGYHRWNSWIAVGGLKTYARRRNESLDVNGVSRMSPYLNAGMVSPMRIAREANATGGAGKGKFMNEFLTWRGVSYGWCYHISKMKSTGCTIDSLPGWARDTLLQHANDPRPQLKTLQQLKNGETGDRGWDGMQKYMVQSGELHNNARMGWGCAVVQWTASPQAAMDTLLLLNDTYSLDGHSPCSYGGLLGCLGLFTGPKGNCAISGKVPVRGVKGKYAALPSKVVDLISNDGKPQQVAVKGNSSSSDTPKEFLPQEFLSPSQAVIDLTGEDSSPEKPPSKRSKWQRRLNSSTQEKEHAGYAQTYGSF